MRTARASFSKHRLNLPVLAIIILVATACATSSDTTQPTTTPETIATTAAPSTTAPSETPPPDVSATQPPTPTTVLPTTSTTLPQPLSDNIAIVTQNSITCSLHSDGTVYCWGGYPFDQDGNRIRFDHDIPNRIAKITNATSITSSRIHVCVTHSDQTVSCWGHNSSGQLGDGTTNNSSSRKPVKAQGISDAIEASAGYDHSCVLHVGGAVSCWGSNEFGQLGNGESSDSYVPARVDGIVDAVAVAAGEDHTCALHAEGAVSCWGSNEFGQLGNGTTENSATPVKVQEITDAVSIAVGYKYSCTIHTKGDVSCWGSNRFGTLGYGDNIDHYDFSVNPELVPGVSQTESLHTDNQYLCALRTDNTAICWGYDKYGIFNGTNGSGADITTPIELSYSRYITSMSAGGGYICVIHTDTTVYCWGYDRIHTIGQNWQEEQITDGKLGRAYTNPNRNLAYIIAPPAQETTA